MKISIAHAADCLLGGGVIACPTEGVYGLSCLPDDPVALLRLLTIKQRDPSKGLILIASNKAQLDNWIDAGDKQLPEPVPSRPTTWLVRAAGDVSPLLRGHHQSLAVRLTTNPIAQAICEAVDSPIVSTSANVAGERPARNQFVLRRKFAGCVDYIVPGDCGPATGASEIRDLQTGQVLRPRAQ
ncbi:MAG: L-threonylcarbamoyladenylate synthase [Gammaproteobacteria bacterium]|nr:L-threonylcarbamoyladenylate synthase [Gammaproteobacteria bacterium]